MGGDGAVAGEPGGFGVGLEQGAVGHDELEFDAGDPAGGAGGAFDEGVGHGLASGAGVPSIAEGVGGAGEGGLDGDALGDGEQGGEAAHGVGGGSEADVPVGGGVRGALGDGSGVAAVRGGPGGGNDGPVAGPVEGSGVGGEFFVDAGPVLGGKAGGFADEEGGAPFVELPGFEGGEGVGHFGDEGFGQAEEPAALGGGFAPGEGDLRADTGTAVLGWHAGVGLLLALEQVEGHRDSGLTRRGGRLQVLQLPDLVNDPGTVSGQRNGGQQSSDSREGPAVVPGSGESRVTASPPSHFGPLSPSMIQVSFGGTTV